MEQKYGIQFKDSLEFHALIYKAFELKQPDDAHAIRFGYIGLEQLFEADSKLVMHGMFKKVKENEKQQSELSNENNNEVTKKRNG